MGSGRGAYQFFQFALLLVLQIHTTDCLIQSCNSNDVNALLGFYNGLENKGVVGWSSNGSSASLDCCSWAGVSCGHGYGAARRVVGLDLSHKSLRGTISSSLASMDELEGLNLSRNSLHGPVPRGLFELPRLRVLDLSMNDLAGLFPANASLPAIETLNISCNSFNGSHPVLASARNLTVLDAGKNAFSGAIDAAAICAAWPAIEALYLSYNDFSGELPTGFAACRNLAELCLGGNSLAGSLPGDLFAMPALQKLELQENLLSGGLSSSLSNLSQLEQIDLSFNNFSGPIPDVLGNLKNLQSFTVASNKFSGTLPPSLSNCSTLRVISLRNNSFSGMIDLDFAALPRLNTFDLGTNQLAGHIPANLAKCAQLKTLNLARNYLVGQIPESFNNFSSLSYLSLTGNHFSNLSSALGILQHLPNLATLVLTNNFRGGETMPWGGIEGFENVQVFVLANCALSGSIPPWLQYLKNLNVLDISWNNLSGTVPPWMGKLDQLFYVDLSNNSLTGELPESLTRMKSFISSNGSNERALMQDFPFFVKRNSSGKALQYNQVSSFPPSLILCYNMLAGPILPGFGHLVKLYVLDLSWNNLSGPIPEELSNMSSLEALDLAHNHLTGSIPSSLTNLSFLSKFDVSYNDLVGEIPAGGQFSTFTNDDFVGNPGLCLSRNSSCTHKASLTVRRLRKNKGAIVGLAIGIGAGVASLLTIIFLVAPRIQSWRQEKAVVNAEDSSEPASSSLVFLFQNKDNKELSIDDILKSTNNFDQACIIGCGGFGLVYKATLPDGRRVAIKRLSGDYCQMEREFKAEVETLSTAQHPNLVLLQGYCKIGNDRLLIYSFMENGSLDYWLHERANSGTVLDWQKRLRIAQGAARGLAYLHQSCEPHILHRDIKSSNILLDENFEAHLADFGLARLICAYQTHITTDVVGTLGYIPPEYGQSSVATFKGDVYSFGVVLLELLTGRRPVDMCRPKGSRDVVSWVVQMKKEKREAEVFDPSIYNKANESEVMRVLEIACLCIVASPKLRPSSQQLVAWLDELDSIESGYVIEVS